MAPLSSILTCSLSVICHLVCSQCSLLSVYLKCVSRFFQWLRIKKQRICLKFFIANGISCAESLKMLQKVYGESTLWKTRAYEWYSAFKSARDVVEDLSRCGLSSTSSTQVNIAKVKEMVTENRYLSLREIGAELSVYHESIRTILNDCLGMKSVAARLVPKNHLTSRVTVFIDENDSRSFPGHRKFFPGHYKNSFQWITVNAMAF